MNYPCEIVEQAPQPALTVHTHCPVQELPQTIGKSYGAIAAYLAEGGEQLAGMPFVIYYNMDMQYLDVEIGFTHPHALPGKGEVRPYTIAAGKYAACLYTGPYPDLGLAYDQLTQFVKDQGYQPSGMVIEYYLNGPDDTPPDKLQTRIMFPLLP